MTSIRYAAPADAAPIAEIYNHYVTHTIVTFEETPVSDLEIERRIAAVQKVDLPWLVVERAGRVVGYAYATPWKDRIGYRFSVESTIYLEAGMQGGGLGTLLYTELIAHLRKRGDIHAVLGGIALPNPGSVALHEKIGMSKVAHLREVGQKFGEWVDVGYWEIIL
jgi:L-amino acid N-acyltransferase YncA